MYTPFAHQIGGKSWLVAIGEESDYDSNEIFNWIFATSVNINLD